MTRHNPIQYLLALLMVLLSACSSMGALPADTFNKKLLAGYSTVEVLAKSAATLRAAGRLSDADRDNVVDTLRNATAGLDLAAQVGNADPAAGMTKLNATLSVLTALQAYLATKGGQ